MKPYHVDRATDLALHPFRASFHCTPIFRIAHSVINFVHMHVFPHSDPRSELCHLLVSLAPPILSDLLKLLVAQRHNGQSVDDVLHGHPEVSSTQRVLKLSSNYKEYCIAQDPVQRGTDIVAPILKNKGIH